MTMELAKQQSDIHRDEKLDTALISLVTAAKALGKSANEKTIRAACGLEKRTLGTRDILRAAKYLKLKAKQHQPQPEELPKLSIPMIALMKDGVYVVVGRNNDKKVSIINPYRGHPEVISFEHFISEWSGELVTIVRPFSIKDAGRHFNIAWFVPVLLRYKRFFGEILLASFFLQLFGLVTPLFTQVIIDKVLVNKGVATLDILAVVLAVCAVFQTGMTILRTYLSVHTTNRVDVIFGTKLFRHIAALPLKYFEQRRVGDTLVRVAAMNTIRDFLTGSAMTVVMDTFFSIVFLAVMFYYSASLTAIALLVLPVYLLQNIIATPRYRERLDAVWAAGAESNAFLVEAVTGIHTVKSLAIEPQFNHRWEQLLAKYVRTTFTSATFNIVINNSSNLIQGLSSFSILWFGGHMVMAGKMTVGQLIAFQMLSGQANAPLLRLVGMWQSFQLVGLSVERLGDILNTPPEQAHSTRQAGLPAVQGAVALEDVTFRYSIDGPVVLNGIHLNIKPGMRVGIVGRSGSGKSTLTKLVQRLYLPEAGRVLIDGMDIAKAEPAWLRRQIGVVLQENYLFSGSVRDNIATARPSASMEEIITVAEVAGAHEFILELPEGYDTKVGERGTSLSGGQRQRIAIARALLVNPRILIFDEATSALDYQSERIIMQNLNQIAAGRTLLMIAHRLSTVRRCDTILVIDRGKVIEQGSHEELMAGKGFYYKLYIQQEV
ncbi:Toxin RTX-I translocation ATP-binding protein [Sporomusa ovata DSM 2662]|uniref:Cyclolysin secretion ATP-binding protein n=1 Tax=Sporomusa ovata TaxID=2378 RepID=A0A0U1L5Z0_9FIRM|nr:type I secretion system permease/ATPase [Sporomusa ovata]EQB26114.1 toxin RTX-I translocation ATP-binding protein [Sporomusa ovata DSM 2662]CQR74689.1 cyclolysin secretion ATP-binding protein [Sporomusa ovata]